MLLSRLHNAGAQALRRASSQEPSYLQEARQVLLCARARKALLGQCCSAFSSNVSSREFSWPLQHRQQQGAFGARRRGTFQRLWRGPEKASHVLQSQHVAGASSSAGEGGSSSNSSKEGGKDANSMVLNLPTFLTVGRVVTIPFLVAAWYLPSPWSTTVVTSLFTAASITDWLDGYLARKMNTTSKFGAFLDPVADKLMVSTLLILMSTQPIPTGPLAGVDWLIPVCTMVIIGREITISALREWAATLGPAARGVVAVNNMGKVKTVAQMTSLTLLLIARDGGSSSLHLFAATSGPALLVVAAYLTLSSMISYLRALWRFL